MGCRNIHIVSLLAFAENGLVLFISVAVGYHSAILAEAICTILVSSKWAFEVRRDCHGGKSCDEISGDSALPDTDRHGSIVACYS